MRTLLLVSACIVLMSEPALACRGTPEYPQAFKQLEQAQVSPERKKELMEQLSLGDSIHKEGHRLGDKSKMIESLRILDGITAEIGK